MLSHRNCSATSPSVFSAWQTASLCAAAAEVNSKCTTCNAFRPPRQQPGSPGSWGHCTCTTLIARSINHILQQPSLATPAHWLYIIPNRQRQRWMITHLMRSWSPGRLPIDQAAVCNIITERDQQERQASDMIFSYVPHPVFQVLSYKTVAIAVLCIAAGVLLCHGQHVHQIACAYSAVGSNGAVPHARGATCTGHAVHMRQRHM